VLRITSAGNVGIGTTNPAQKLDVAGNINVSAGSAYMYNGVNVITASTTLGNYFFGSAAGNLTMTGSNNFANGYGALLYNTTGSSNVANGYAALQYNTTGNYNVANGSSALINNTTGSSNVANGTNALYTATSTTGTIALGYFAGYRMSGATGTVGNYNTLVGYFSGYGIITGARNVFLGQSTIAASYNQVTTGSNNIAIGNDVAVPSATAATANNQLVIGNLIYGTGLNGTGSTVSTGNLGIGTTTPFANFVINGTTGQNLLQVATSTNQSILVVTQNGNVGIGTASPVYLLHVAGNGAFGNSTAGGKISLLQTNGSPNASVTVNASNELELYGYNGFNFVGSGTNPVQIDSGNNGVNWKVYDTQHFNFVGYTGHGGEVVMKNVSDGTEVFHAYLADTYKVTFPNGNVGIGTTSPDTLLSVGSATPTGSVAHFENSTGSCYINPTTTSLSCSSDARLKTNVVSITSDEGLAALLKLNPVTFNWKAESATSSPHTGFIAQAVQPIFPDLISQGPDGFYTMNYAGLTPYLVKAVQQIATITDAFEQNLIAWLGNASNGIEAIFAHEGHFSDRLCVGSGASETCINQQQLAALLATSNQSAAAPTSPSQSGSTATDTPPVIAINGNNPATVQVGETYNDLGATITGPQADLNLGIRTFVGTTPMEQAAIDTSTSTTYHIVYVVTDSQGLTSTSTRTVIVEPAASHTTPPPPASSADATSSATSTVQ